MKHRVVYYLTVDVAVITCAPMAWVVLPFIVVASGEHNDNMSNEWILYNPSHSICCIIMSQIRTSARKSVKIINDNRYTSVRKWLTFRQFVRCWKLQNNLYISIYTVFQKNGHPFSFFDRSVKWWLMYTKFLPVVVEEILIQNVSTKCAC